MIQENLQEILGHIQNFIQEQNIYEKKLLDIYEGQLKKYLEESLELELSPSSFNTIRQRLNTTNVLPKVINKQTQLYKNPVTRICNDKENLTDTELLDFYSEKMLIDSKFNSLNKMLNLFKYAALEIYFDKRNSRPALRVLNPTQFTVWSNDSNDPTNPTVFVKYMGSEEKSVPRTNTSGVITTDAEQEIINVNIYYLYSKDEFLIVDSQGSVRLDKMGTDDISNPLGVIPFIYFNLSENRLIPLPNSDMLDMILLFPKLFSDLNYAMKFLSHSIIYGIDVDTGNLSLAPDSFWEIKSDEGEGKSPEIGSIKPTVDVDKAITLIKESFVMWLDSLGLKTNSSGSLDKDNLASGVSKIIDDADNSSLVSEHKKLFVKKEKEFWDKIKKIHLFWIDNYQDINKAFSDAFEVSVTYEEYKPIVDTKTKIEEIKLKLESGLTSKKRALAEANPDLDAEEIDELYEEIKNEKEDLNSILNNFQNRNEVANGSDQQFTNNNSDTNRPE